MSRKYIRENRNSFAIVKNSRVYGNFKSLDDAVFVRDILIANNWDLGAVDEIYGENDQYIAVRVIDERLHILAKSKEKPSKEMIDNLAKRRIRNPNNSKYGLNITRIFDTFIIKKQIAGDEQIFGFYDSLEDAEFVRNHLLDNQWDVNSISEIQYDDDKGNYKVTEVIDDRAYVLATFEDENEIDLMQAKTEFLNRIAKHKLGLASHDHLSELTDSIAYLEERFGIDARDDVWDFKDTRNPLNDVVFNLTPFQKSVYDAVDDSTVEDIEKSLVRFKSKNFTQKIQKSLDELEKKGLIAKNQNHYNRRNP